MIASQTDCGQIHDPQLTRQHFIIGQSIIAFRIGVFHRIVGVDAVDFRGLEHQVCIDLDCAQAGSRICSEKGIAGTGREDNYVATVQVAHGPAVIVMLDHAVHWNRTHHMRRDVAALKRITQC